MLEKKVFGLMVTVLSLLMVAFAQGAARQDPVYPWGHVPEGFTLERYVMNADDEVWLSERAQEATGRTCEAYDRQVLKYVGDPSGLTVTMLEPVDRVREALGEGSRIVEDSEGGMVLVNGDDSVVADVDYLWTDVPPYGVMARYELTWCRTGDPATAP